MRARLSCVIVAVLLVGVDTAPTPSAGTQLVFPPGSRWGTVKGRQGELDLTFGCVEFLKDGELSLSWFGIDRQAFVRSGFSRIVKCAYEPDPKNSLAIVLRAGPPDRIEGRGRLVGNLLEIRITKREHGSTYAGPGGEVYLLLKLAK